MRGLTINTIHNKNTMSFVTPGHRGDRLKIILVEKEQISDILFFERKKVFFKELPPNIMVTRNPNWSIEILWYEIGYVKWKILPTLKRPT
jgi:hypothetical protein